MQEANNYLHYKTTCLSDHIKNLTQKRNIKMPLNSSQTKYENSEHFQTSAEVALHLLVSSVINICAEHWLFGEKLVKWI